MGDCDTLGACLDISGAPQPGSGQGVWRNNGRITTIESKQPTGPLPHPVISGVSSARCPTAEAKPDRAARLIEQAATEAEAAISDGNAPIDNARMQRILTCTL
jgi:hypothetical protein